MANKQFEIEIKVGLFVALGIGLVMLAILVLGSTENFLARKNTYSVHFPTVEGLLVGAKVVLGGLQVGTVKSIGFDPEKHNVRVELSVAKDSSEWIRSDSFAEIVTQGVLGDKYVTISTGNQNKPPIPVGADIPVRMTKDLSQFLNKGDQLLVSLNSLAANLDHVLKTFQSANRSEIFFDGMATTAKNLAQVSEKLNRELDGLNARLAVRNLNAILDKINNGTGTLGALVNDPGLYEDAKSLVGGANRNRIMRNLIRKTIKESEQKNADESPKSP
ncbi:MAG: hypothetical protein A2428_06155 [Bdellovibrionales bacterium RIFOXYC1_FULL_54_43]|nr:MAG: hypothetical protein A2428_06155 [Bdellovibrionales bacterium RIFOXYC1_FULL_54_43]OFZ81540.1 MAG: hypothetical protein A2603_10035 [Bdellovibrionales bacterium RIFOXYD1_FULL_55_31]